MKRLSPQIAEDKRVGWVDFLRVLACFMVVLSHACDPFVGQFDSDKTAFLNGAAIGSLMRPCVPLFVMMTGVLLLPVSERDSRLSSFYGRRLGRLVWPLVFWSVMLPVMGYCYFNYVNPDTANAMLSSGMYDTERFIPRMWTWIFNFNYDTTALWYLYMLVGLYLIIPILNAWLVSASRSDIRTVLFIWGISLCVPYVTMFAPALGYEGNYGNFGILGVCDWNAFGTFYYVSGFAGYLVLAYYLKKYPLDWSPTKLYGLLIPMFLAGYAVTFGGFVWIQTQHPGDYAYLEIIWLFCGINVFMMTFPIFAIVRNMRIRPSRALTALASLTFGIYLVHFPFESAGYDLLAGSGLPHWLRISLSAVMIFALSGAIVWLMRQWRVSRRFVA